MSLSYHQGYPHPNPHHHHHPHHHPHQTHPYHPHHPHHPALQSSSMTPPTGTTTAAAAAAAAQAHDFYSPYPGGSQMPRYQDAHDTTTVAAAAVAAGGYFSNWMLSPPNELSAAVSGHIPDGYHSFGAPGSNSPGGTQYQSFIQYENGVPVRCIKRRVTANKKERRRTLSINNAFSQLRGCIPNVPSDTKLSKIKTLRLATSYISYLMDVLAKDDPELSKNEFKAEFTKKSPGTGMGTYSTSSGGLVNSKCDDDTVTSAITQARNILDRNEDKMKRDSDGESETSSQGSSPCPDKKTKGRTGWPQHVWAAELK